MVNVRFGSDGKSEQQKNDMASIFGGDEIMRILKLKYYNSIVDHLNGLQRDPDSALLYSLMELHLDTGNTEFNSVLNYLSYWKEGRGY